MTEDDYNELGADCYEKGQYQQAIHYYNQAIDLDANCAGYYVNRGSAYLMLENYMNAVDDVTKALSLDSTYAHAYVIRAAAYAFQGNNVVAISDYTKALKLNPHDDIILEKLNHFLQPIKKQQLLEIFHQFPQKKEIKLIAQALNKNTLLGKKFLEPICGLIPDIRSINTLKKRYKMLTQDRVEVRKAARMISQARRDETQIHLFKFFRVMPIELDRKIIEKVAKNLSQKTISKIIKDNFEKPNVKCK